MTWDNLKPPTPNDGWGTPPKNDPDAIQTDGGWSVHPDQTSPMTVSYEEWAENENNYPPPNAVEELREAIFVTDGLMSAKACAGVVNSLAGTRDAFNVDPDGELTRMREIATGEKPVGYYVAYSNGRWLHAILSGPYATMKDVDNWSDVAYDMMTNDTAFQLAFENKFDRSGIYCVEIPLASNRKGAYGVLS